MNQAEKLRRGPYVLVALVILTAAFFLSSRERLVDPDERAYLLVVGYERVLQIGDREMYKWSSARCTGMLVETEAKAYITNENA